MTGRIPDGIWHDWSMADLARCDPHYAAMADGSWDHTPSDFLWAMLCRDSHPVPQLPATAKSASKMESGWREMVDRAKRDLETIESEWKVKHLAAACTPEDVQVFLEAMK